ncbi:putative Mitogen-activated protein kinase kinase kinase 2 [Paratrimastix pyriformis]|uniref:Mitogen-activated protein kinase kinase kinase 2 n=1 Tax=Paratrimastix pyriformis TaxID=342808 RepID=A0ABQ8UJZ0_9EUKA|nr:putative Mitogen-activated protein kinase kinase kinase 2 [Paratrimastix pyriformis]|eukprot:GAFH01001932.1.p1 GENE.GAFH01001932.1~~GAFH01001932.1.p1  ORF type:complete len:393 (-),score=35.68 GAFH01001932.1:123-1301(-)
MVAVEKSARPSSFHWRRVAGNSGTVQTQAPHPMAQKRQDEQSLMAAFFSTPSALATQIGDLTKSTSVMITDRSRPPTASRPPPDSEESQAESDLGSNMGNVVISQPHPVTPPATLDRPATAHTSETLFLKRGDLIGRGSFGSVYRCLDLKTGRFVADKEFVFVGEHIEEQIQNAEREIRIMEQLSHPNIVRYVGCERNDMVLDVFQEFIAGGPISKLLSQFGPFPEELVQCYTRQILAGLEYLHSNKIVHRDIKSANCLVTGEGVVKLADFGCSRTIETVMSYSQGCATLCGTPHYMAPEVVRQQRNVGRRSDIWSLGCTVVEMVTGSPPYADIKNATACIYKIASTNELPPIPDNISPQLRDFLHCCFVRDPLKRATAHALLEHPFMTRTY